jgi:hypothetical protein
VGEVLAMPIRPGVFFEPEVIGLMGEALETACKLLPGASQHEIVREVMARRIIAAASTGERDPVRLRAVALSDLADECSRLAAMSSSTEMRKHYSRLSEHYSTLAEAEVLGGLAYGAATLEGGSKASSRTTSKARTAPNY